MCFAVGGLTMFSLTRHFGVHKRRLSGREAADLVLNPQRPRVGEHVVPIAAALATGVEATVSYAAEDIAAALTARRHSLLFVSLVLAPLLFATAVVGFGLALLVGQPVCLLAGIGVVASFFVATPAIILVQAIRARAQGANT